MIYENVSLICTLKNEEESIELFLNSILNQSARVSDIIIVDGGSDDNTVKIIQSYIDNGAPIKLIIEQNKNIAQGRNIAINQSIKDIIVTTDAGCILENNWLENLIKPFYENQNIDVVAGWYIVTGTNEFEKCIAEVISPDLEKVRDNPDKFLPSSRSFAFKKECWRNVGGYPEWLNTAEDSLFCLKLKKQRYKFFFAEKAVVFWRTRSTLKNFYKQTYFYARGDGEATIFFKSYILTTYFPIFLFGIISFYNIFLALITLLVSLIIYFFIRFRTKGNHRSLRQIFYLLIIITTLNVGKLFGYTIGLIRRFLLRGSNVT